MQCPDCQSTRIRKNGKTRGKQNYIYVSGRPQFIQFIDSYTVTQGYSDAQYGTKSLKR
jgi:transposase-like protein